MSMTNSIRFTFTGGLGSTLTGNSLADELNFDDTDDQTDMDGGESILSSPRHKRNFSRDSVASKIHRRNCSMDSLKRTGPPVAEEPLVSESSPCPEPAKETEASPPKMLSRMTSATFPLTLSIPSINIEPPKSLPTSPTEDQRLPQYFKHFGCQVNMPVDVAGGDLVSVTGRSHARSMMTHPDSLASPISLGGFDDDLHDDLSLDVMRTSSHKSGPLRPPHRLSSIQSGLYSGSSDEMDEFADADISDLEYRTALSAPRPPVAFPRHVKRNTSIKSPTSPEESRSGRSSAMTIRTELYSSYSLGDRQFKAGGGGKPARNVDKPLPSLPRSPSGASVRKAAMIQNGMASHRARSSSPSVADTIVPPFPIPARASSRPSISVSIPSEGQDSPGMGFWYRRDSVDRVPPRGQIRRARSSISLTRNPQYHRSSSRSPPISPSTETPLSPILQPLPAYDMSTSHFQEDDDSFRGHRPRLSNNTDITTNTELQSQAGSHQTPGVVEAIAQTMVGEWMFKYMRRRKSFGVIDNANKDENSNERHKRWVWLAPYERAILWSSKQPSSGSALMGKAGRKLIIQSVLDVKDDNPPPRGATLFNRSILILTPQRALKFTASTSERHYLWLTALSFLSHSSQPGTDMLSPTYLNPHQQALPSFNVPQGKTKRGGLKDTIRFTKSWRVQEKELPEIPAAASIPTAQLGEGFANMAMAWGNGNNGASEAARQQGNFFDAIGTVRMEAFINPTAFSAFAEDPDEEEELRPFTARPSGLQ
ncbi:Anucleate primary sterigmata protein A [Escovopsis weberi]|uniref:Anucleate primary sterigmata protein A n=1 Tax=Escovopsis weberi TaxID=150374 RepID=A0A0M8N7B3_ESCWE|nr:Anucleate primary sterigmata protein A [Escovopsis weberi]